MNLLGLAKSFIYSSQVLLAVIASTSFFIMSFLLLFFFFFVFILCVCVFFPLTLSQPACRAAGSGNVDNLKLDAEMMQTLKRDPITFGAYLEYFIHSLDQALQPFVHLYYRLRNF